MKRIHPVFRGLALTLAVACSSQGERIAADLLIRNAEIVTPDSTCHRCYVTISNGRIEGVFKIRPEGDFNRTLDLDGSFLYAGFIDAHSHFVGYGKSLQTVDLRGTQSWEEVVERTKIFAEAHPGLPAITGRGWDQNDWELKEFPTNELLNEAFPETQVVLTRIDGHAVIANAFALDYAHISKNTAGELSGGQIAFGSNDKPTGLLIDNAVDLLQLPDLDNEQLKEAIRMAENRCFEVGLTTVTDAGLDKPVIELLDSMHRSGELKMRIYAMISDRPEWRSYYLEHGPYHTDRLNVRSFKFYGDGALGSRGACLIKPYHDRPDEQGFLLSDPEHFRQAAGEMAEAGFQMNTHAIGDSANRLILDIYREYTTGQDLRWRIEHAQVIHRDDFKKFSGSGIIPSVQPTHATSDMYWAEDRLGSDRIKHAYAYQDLLDQAGLVALGTDFPIEDIAPLNTFYAAVVRKDHNGYPEGGFQINNALSREDALRGMTEWAAYANFEENEKGSVAPGKWADFTILDTDLLHCPEDEILNTRVLYTIVAGEVVYQHDQSSENE